MVPKNVKRCLICNQGKTNENHSEILFPIHQIGKNLRPGDGEVTEQRSLLAGVKLGMTSLLHSIKFNEHTNFTSRYKPEESFCTCTQENKYKNAHSSISLKAKYLTKLIRSPPTEWINQLKYIPTIKHPDTYKNEGVTAGTVIKGESQKHKAVLAGCGVGSVGTKTDHMPRLPSCTHWR